MRRASNSHTPGPDWRAFSRDWTASLSLFPMRTKVYDLPNLGSFKSSCLPVLEDCAAASSDASDERRCGILSPLVTCAFKFTSRRQASLRRHAIGGRKLGEEAVKGGMCACVRWAGEGREEIRDA